MKTENIEAINGYLDARAKLGNAIDELEKITGVRVMDLQSHPQVTSVYQLFGEYDGVEKHLTNHVQVFKEYRGFTFISLHNID